MSANVSLLNSANSKRLIQESLGRVHSPERSYSFHKNSLGGQIRPELRQKKGIWARGRSVDQRVSTCAGVANDSVRSSLDASILNQRIAPTSKRAAIGTKGAS